MLMQKRGSLPVAIYHAIVRAQPECWLPHARLLGEPEVLQTSALTTKGLLKTLGCFVKPELLQQHVLGA